MTAGSTLFSAVDQEGVPREERCMAQLTIGFPPPLLGAQPKRLTLYAQSQGWFCLEKPAGVSVEEGDFPGLTKALNLQIDAEKPELVRLGLQRCANVTNLACEISGPVLFAEGRKRRAELRDIVGSRRLSFTFAFWTRHESQESEITCDAPIVCPADAPPRISRNLGKRSETLFTRVGESGEFWFWEALSSYPRPGQIRLHAQRCGIAVLGDATFGSEPPVKSFLGERSRFRWEGPCMRLIRLQGLPDLPTEWPTEAAWAALGKRLGRAVDARRFRAC